MPVGITTRFPAGISTSTGQTKSYPADPAVALDGRGISPTSMPEGNIWNIYADLLTVPEDTDGPKERPALVIREEVVQRLEEFDKYKPVGTDELL